MTEAIKLLKAGHISTAIELCESERYSEMPACQRFLGAQYQKKGDSEKAVEWFSRALSAGDNDALSHFLLASAYFWNRNYSKAMQHFESAADLGNARAFYWLGRMYERGSGAERDIGRAIAYYEKSGTLGVLQGERDWLRLIHTKGSLFTKLRLLPKRISFFIKGVRIARANIDDPRLIDLKAEVGRRKRKRNDAKRTR